MTDDPEARYACPVDGCDYTGLKRSVTSHYSGKRDDQHQGGYEKARGLLDDAQPISRGSDDGQAQTDSGAAEQASSQAPASDGGNNPLSEGPGQTPVKGGSQTTTDGPDDSGDSGPCCDSPAYTAVPAGTRFTTDDGRVAVTEDGDKFCEACSAVVSTDGTVVR